MSVPGLIDTSLHSTDRFQLRHSTLRTAMVTNHLGDDRHRLPWDELSRLSSGRVHHAAVLCTIKRITAVVRASTPVAVRLNSFDLHRQVMEVPSPCAVDVGADAPWFASGRRAALSIRCSVMSRY